MQFSLLKRVETSVLGLELQEFYPSQIIHYDDFDEDGDEDEDVKIKRLKKGIIGISSAKKIHTLNLDLSR